MKEHSWQPLAAVCALALASFCAVPANAQTSEVKEKPPMYSYVANWNIPRAQWAEVDKANAADAKILEKAVASGTIIAFGDDSNIIHQPDGFTHDSWWSAMSMAGLLNVLDEMYKAGTPTTPVFSSATKHSDGIFVSRYYNWHSGSVKNGYTHGSFYKLKADAPDDAVESLSKNLIVPMMEKLLSDGTIAEYEVDTEAIHTESPGLFTIFYISPTAEGLDKVSAALQERLKTNPLGGTAFGSMIDYSAHRDELTRTNATYK
jgi:hypothetical protein